MDRVVVAEKLESLRRCVQRIEERRAPTADALRADADRQDIVSLNLTRAVQLCVDLAAHVLGRSNQPPPQTMGESFDALAAEGIILAALAKRLRGAVGFRNIAVHSYQAIDWNIVHAITYDGLDDFRQFAASVDALIE